MLQISTHNETLKISQKNIIFSFIEYEKSLNFMNNPKRLNDLLVFLNIQLNNKINDTTLESIFFKNFIGHLNIKKILTELLVNQINV
jgi:hypothetical protein